MRCTLSLAVKYARLLRIQFIVKFFTKAHKKMKILSENTLQPISLTGGADSLYYLTNSCMTCVVK